MQKRLKSSGTNFDEKSAYQKPGAANKEREAILKALQSNNWNRSQAATALKM
ncbi:MAG: two-component system response regulator, partial [Proteobacteria bacterium]|nr:two-component system response regulator [Pseudomonadota bacterium]